jgi:hypothetical protein
MPSVLLPMKSTIVRMFDGRKAARSEAARFGASVMECAIDVPGAGASSSPRPAAAKGGHLASPAVPATCKHGAPAMRNDDDTDVRNTLFLALGLWAVAVAGGTQAEVFARLPVGVLIALTLFLAAFATGVVTVDARVRGWLDRRRDPTCRVAILAVAGVAAAAAAGLATVPAAGSLAMAPWAPILLFGFPVSLALGVWAARAAWRQAAGSPTRPASTEPARHPAATSGSRTSAASPGVARARAAG